MIISTTSDASDSLTERFRVKPSGVLRAVPLPADPGSGEPGDFYFNGSTGKWRRYVAGAWAD